MSKYIECKAGERICLEGIHNTRDLGGYQTKDGGRIRPHRLLRSGALHALTSQDITCLTKEYELKTVVDFRTNAEVEEKPDPVIQGVREILNPILSDAQMGITHEGEGNQTTFIKMMVTYAKKLGEHPETFGLQTYPPLVTEAYPIEQYKKFFSYLLEQEEGAILWHCTAGKDRVGTGTALLLSALGVDKATIMQDYLLTNTFLKNETDQLVQLISQKVQDETLLKGVRILSGVEQSYLEAIFTTIDTRYGCMDIFLEQYMGLTKKKKEKLQELYLY